jgi:hypothetical protein
MTDAAPTAQKQRGKPFARGVSGNPAGRRRGSRNAALVALDRLGEEAAADVVRVVIAAARAGDLTAARTLLDRVWPARKGRAVALPLPPVATPAGVVAALAVVVATMAEGALTPDEASAVAAVIEGQRRAIETEELAARIAALEGQHE